MAEEKSLADVADKISAGNMQIDLMAKSLDDVKMESSTGEIAVKQIKDLMEKQSSMTAKEQRASRKQIDAIAKMIQDSSEIGDSDKQKFRIILQQHDERIKSDSSLMGQVGDQITERLVQSVTNIGAVVGGVVSDSPLLALGVKFLGDSVVKGVQTFKAFRKKNKEEKQLRQRQQQLFKEQERIDSEERRVLREQLTEKDLQNKLNLTEEDIQRKAEESNRSREDIINEEKDKIIEQSKIAKQIKDNENAEAKRIKELKDNAGLITAADEEKAKAEKEKRKAEKEKEEAEADQITGEAGERIESSLVSRVTEGGDSDTTTSTNIIREIGADFPEVVPVSSPFLKEIRDLLEFLSSQQSQGELNAIETERERRRSDQANLRVERQQNNLIAESIEASSRNDDSEGFSLPSMQGIPGGGMMKGMKGIFTGLGSSLKKLSGIGKAMNGLTKGLKVFRFLGNIITKLPMMLSLLISPIALKVIAAVAAVSGTIAFFRSELPQKIGEFVQGIPEKVSTAVTTMLESIKQFFADMIEKVKAFLKAPFDLVKNTADKAKETVKEGLEGAKQFVGDAAETVSDVASNGLNFVKDAIGFGGDDEPQSNVTPVTTENINQTNVTAIRDGVAVDGSSTPVNQNVTGISPDLSSPENANVSIIPTELAQGTQSPSQSVAVRESIVIPAGESAPIEQVSGAPTQELGNISSPMAGVRSSAANVMKENAIERSAATNISPILNNLSNVTNNNVSNSSSTVIPTKAYNTENSFNKINSALSGAV